MENITSNPLDLLVQLQDQINRDLKVCTDPEDNAWHLQALTAVETLIDYLN